MINTTDGLKRCNMMHNQPEVSLQLTQFLIFLRIEKLERQSLDAHEFQQEL